MLIASKNAHWDGYQVNHKGSQPLISSLECQRFWVDLRNEGPEMRLRLGKYSLGGVLTHCKAREGIGWQYI